MTAAGVKFYVSGMPPRCPNCQEHHWGICGGRPRAATVVLPAPKDGELIAPEVIDRVLDEVVSSKVGINLATLPKDAEALLRKAIWYRLYMRVYMRRYRRREKKGRPRERRISLKGVDLVAEAAKPAGGEE